MEWLTGVSGNPLSIKAEEDNLGEEPDVRHVMCAPVYSRWHPAHVFTCLFTCTSLVVVTICFAHHHIIS